MIARALPAPPRSQQNVGKQANEPELEPMGEEPAVAAAPEAVLGKIAAQPRDIVAAVVVDDQQPPAKSEDAVDIGQGLGARRTKRRPHPDDDIGRGRIGQQRPAGWRRGDDPDRAPASLNWAARRPPTPSLRGRHDPRPTGASSARGDLCPDVQAGIPRRGHETPGSRSEGEVGHEVREDSIARPAAGSGLVEVGPDLGAQQAAEQ